jgi:hypothetical protein
MQGNANIQIQMELLQHHGGHYTIAYHDNLSNTIRTT